MRFDLDNLLWAEQRKRDYLPALKVTIGDYEFTLEEFSSCANTAEINPTITRIEGGRIWEIEHTEEAWRSPCKIVLNNADKLLTNISLEGLICRIGWGAKVTDTDTDEGDSGVSSEQSNYSTCAPMRVREQRDDSVESNGMQLTTTIKCRGIIEELDDDKAVVEYVSEGDETLKTILQKVLRPQELEFGAYEHCSDYVIDFDSEDDLLNTVIPGSSFTIQIDESRLQVVSKIMEQTYCVIKAGYEEADWQGRMTFHVMKPKTDWPTYDYEYSLDEGSHGFWAKTAVKSLVVPNYIIVETPINALVTYSGYAKDVFSYNRYPKKRLVRIAGVDSDAAASGIAEAILSKIQAGREIAAGRLPMNFGQEVYDYVKITDIRDSKTLVGNIGSITRYWKAATDMNPNIMYMTFTFGGWLDVEKIFKLPSYSDIDMLRAEHHTPMWYIDGELSLGDAQSATFAFPYDVTWTGVWTHIDPDVPADGDIEVDICVDGISIHTDSSKCTIVTGQSEGFVAPTGDDVIVIPAWSKISMNIDSIGSSDKGFQLTVELFVRFDK